MIIIFIFVGIGLVVYSVIKFKPVDNNNGSLTLTDETLERLTNTINDADSAMEEMSKLSQNIFDEMADKYKEMIYLYHLVDEKYKSVQDGSYSNVPQVDYGDIEQRLMTSVMESINKEKEAATPTQENLSGVGGATANNESFMTIFNTTNPKHKEIQELSAKGLSISEIAKSLDLGQGEVKLVLDLGKR